MGDDGCGGARRRETPMAFGAAVPEDYVAIWSIPSVSRCSIPRSRPPASSPPPPHAPSPRVAGSPAPGPARCRTASAPRSCGPSSLMNINEARGGGRGGVDHEYALSLTTFLGGAGKAGVWGGASG